MIDPSGAMQVAREFRHGVVIGGYMMISRMNLKHVGCQLGSIQAHE
jgi:hypothetical protein